MTDNTFRNLFRHRLVVLMGESTHEEFAKQIGICRPTLTHYLTGRRLPNAEMLYKICRATGCSADWLLGTEGTKHG